MCNLPKTSTTSRPDIVFILMDTLRADRLGFYGYPGGTTPNIDRVCREGMVFENTIVSAPWTLPSHASLFTGRYPAEHGVSDEQLVLRDDIPTLAELLNQTGYQTVAYATDNGWLSDDTGLMRGFRQFYGPNYKLQERTGKKKSRLALKIEYKIKTLLGIDPNDHLKAVIEMFDRDMIGWPGRREPFFLFLHVMDTHMPYRPSPKAMKKFGLDKVDPKQLRYLQDKFREYRASPQKLGAGQIELLARLYDACVATADTRLCRLFKLIRDRSNDSNMVLIVTSDHGEQLGEHGMLNHWMALYDTLLRVPLVIWSPGRLPGGMRISPQVQQHNLFYTVLDLAGYDGTRVDAEMIKSKSLVEMAGGRSPFPEYTFAQQSYAKATLEHILKYDSSFNNTKLIQPKQAVRSNQFKYIRYGTGEEELFDIKRNPAETENILTTRGDIADIMRRKLDELSSGIKTEPRKEDVPEFDREVRKRLEDLGYM